MAQEQLKIFVSAVTSEFGKARDAVASDLRARGHIVRVQSDFQQGPNNETLLGRLAEYIRDCNAVFCVVGKHCGSGPPPRAAAEFAKALPDGIKEASFTQWEFFLARHYGRRTYVYVASEDYKADEKAVDDDRTDLQGAYLAHLEAAGVHYTKFADSKELRIAVLRDEPKIVGPPEPERRAKGKPIVLPYPSIGDLFKGREDFMARLRDSLTRARGARTAIFSQALYGLGGIGKTRVAVEYAWANVDDYSALLFVVAETPEALRRNLAALSARLTPQLDTTEDTVKLAAVLDWLATNPGWFLILDNVDSKPALAEVERLLSGLSGGHVVVTSRLADFSGHFEPLELDVLAIEDAAAFLLERTKDRRRATPEDEVRAREIAQELDGLALALEQAAAFISKRRLTFAQYLEQWRAKRDEVLAWFDPTVTDYPRAVAVTWQTSVAQLSEGGRRLLERLAWLAPEKVPESLLDLLIPDAKGEDLYAAYDDLAAYSLVSRDAEGPFFLVHRLVQDVTRRSLAGESRQCRLIEALSWINNAFTGDPTDVRDWPTLEPLIPHVRAATMYADSAGIADPPGRLTNQLGLLLEAKALYAEAELLYRRALAIAEKNFGPDHPEMATALNNLAALLQNTNRFAEAEPMMRRALAIAEKSFQPGEPKVATYLNNLAQLLQETNRLAEAEPMMRRALAIDEDSFGANHRDVATDLNNLARLLRATNRLPEAEPLYRRALAIDERSFGADHPKVAIRLNNLAILLQETKRFTEAEPMMRRALAIDENSLGPDHPDVGADLNNLAGLLRATDRLADAEPLYRRALAIAEKSFGPDHPMVATILSNLAGLLQATDRLLEAEPMMRRAVGVAVKFTIETGHRHVRLDTRLSAYKGLLSGLSKSQTEIDSACAELMRRLAGASSAPARSAGEGDHPERA